MRELPPLIWADAITPFYEHVEFLGEGEFCECFLLDATTVVRIAKHERASRSLMRELRLLPALADRVDAPLPRIRNGGIRIDTGARFVTYPLLHGTALAPESLALLERSDRLRLIEQMAGFARQLHSVPVEIARSLGLPELNPVEYLPTLLAEAAGPIRPHLSSTSWSYYELLVEQYLQAPALRNHRLALLHGDLSSDHFLADLQSCNLSGVIDFGDACIGDPFWDLIYLLQDYGKAFLAEFLNVYDPEASSNAIRRIHIYQQLHNLQYSLSIHEEGDAGAFAESIQSLTDQAATPLL